MTKSADAFRTISEVADWLDTPAHVLRFWESKFSQVKPVKRAGGRRYYRPQDMQLLGGIKKLLHDDGMTIKGVQKLLRQQGVKHVASLSQPLVGGMAAVVPPVEAEAGQVVDFRPKPASEQTPEPVSEPAADPGPDNDDASEVLAPSEPAAAEAEAESKEPASVPTFLSRGTGIGVDPAKAEETQEPAVAQTSDVQPKEAQVSLNIDVPPDPDDNLLGDAGILSQIAALPHPLSQTQADALAPFISRLQQIVDRAP